MHEDMRSNTKMKINGATDIHPMLDVYLPMMKTAAIVSAGQLGLFEALADGPLDISALANVIKASEEGIDHLGNFLVTMGYLEKCGKTFFNTQHTTRWFTQRGDVDYTAGLLWTAEAWKIMSSLTDAIKNGAPEKQLWDIMIDRPEMGPIFSRYMHAFAQHLGPDLLKNVPLPEGSLRLLDLGGSHGLHTIGFCRHYPELSAVIVDMDSALTNTDNLIRQEDLSDRVTIMSDDLLYGNWGKDYDVVLYLSVAHNQTIENNQKVLKHIAHVMKPGGSLVIHEYLADSQANPYYTAFRLTLLTETGTCTYSFDEISSWLKELGFEGISRVDLNPIEKGSLIIARR